MWHKLLHNGVEVVAHDANGLVALDKPCGILSHPNRKGEENLSLLTCRYNAHKQAYCDKDAGEIYLLNRLDSPVSGLILIGLNAEVAEAVKTAFKTKKVAKKYVALVKGFPRQKIGIWRSRMQKTVMANGKTKAVSGTGPIAETKFELIKSFRLNGVTLSIVSLFPITGKMHQLRIHCSENGLPIVGDDTHGDVRFNATYRKNFGDHRLFLHSEEVALSYDMHAQIFNFHATSIAAFPPKFFHL
jgi:23S rRNA-/tRNA-specific pseudouridylate synthase